MHDAGEKQLKKKKKYLDNKINGIQSWFGVQHFQEDEIGCNYDFW